MLKRISKIKTTFLRLVEDELLTVLAVCVVMLGVFLVRADTSASTNLSFSITDTITVTQPNGGDNWQVGTVGNVTWTGGDGISNIKIELQRTTGGAWETIVSSTDNDGSYPWVITSPTTTTATVKVSDADDAGVYDTSDSTFTISQATTTPSSSDAGGGHGGGGFSIFPGIDSVNPRQFSNISQVELIIGGFNFENKTRVFLGRTELYTRFITSKEIRSLVKAGFKPGEYNLCVHNSGGVTGCYGIPIVVYSGLIPPTTGGKPGAGYSAALVRQSPDLTLKPREEATLWVEFENTGTATWYQSGKNPLRLGTDSKRDRRSAFYHNSWILKNRPALVNKVVEPGEIGRFEFIVKAPWAAGKYTESFRPVAEYEAWMGGTSQVRWVLTVQKRSLFSWFKKPATAQPIVKPTVPSTGGKVETFFKPGNMLIFTDRIEQIYQSAITLFNSILGKLRK